MVRVTLYWRPGHINTVSREEHLSRLVLVFPGIYRFCGEAEVTSTYVPTNRDALIPKRTRRLDGHILMSSGVSAGYGNVGDLLNKNGPQTFEN